MKCQISVSAPNRKHPEPVVRGVEAVEKLCFSSSLSIETTLSIEFLTKSRALRAQFFVPRIIPEVHAPGEL